MKINKIVSCGWILSGIALFAAPACADLRAVLTPSEIALSKNLTPGLTADSTLHEGMADLALSGSNALTVTLTDPLSPDSSHSTCQANPNATSCDEYININSSTLAPFSSQSYPIAVQSSTGKAALNLTVDTYPTFLQLPANAAKKEDYFGALSAKAVYLDPSNDNIYALTANGLSISTDHGLTWANKTSADGLNPAADTVYASGKIVLVGGNGLEYSQDGGATWSAISTFSEQDVYSLSGSGQTVYVATSAGVFVSSDQGQSWQPLAQQPGQIVDMIYDGGKGEVYAYYKGDTLFSGFYTYDESTAHWDNGYDFGEELTALYSDGNTLYLGVNDDGTSGLYTYNLQNNPSKMWTSVGSALGLGGVMNGIYASGDNIDITTTNGLLVSADGGESFKVVQSGKGANDLKTGALNQIVSDGESLYVGTFGYGIEKGDLTASQWQDITATGPAAFGGEVQAVFSQGNLICAGTLNGIAISTDAGKTWSFSSVGSEAVSINSIDVVNGTIFVGTYTNGVNGGAYYSTDEGKTWTAITALTVAGNIAAISDAGDGKHVYAVADEDSGAVDIYVSASGGSPESWQKVYTIPAPSSANAPVSSALPTVFAAISGEYVYVAKSLEGLAISNHYGLPGSWSLNSSVGADNPDIQNKFLALTVDPSTAKVYAVLDNPYSGVEVFLYSSLEGGANFTAVSQDPFPHVYALYVSNQGQNFYYTINDESNNPDNVNGFYARYFDAVQNQIVTTRYTVTDGLPSNNAFSLYLEGSRIYVGTDHGLAVWR